MGKFLPQNNPFEEDWIKKGKQFRLRNEKKTKKITKNILNWEHQKPCFLRSKIEYYLNPFGCSYEFVDQFWPILKIFFVKKNKGHSRKIAIKE